MKIFLSVAVLFGLQFMKTNGQTSEAKGTCLKSGNDWYLRAFVYSNSDGIDNVYGMSQAGVSKQASCDLSTIGQIQGNGSDSNPYYVEVHISSGSISSPTADCGISLAGQVVKLDLQTRRTYTEPAPLNTMLFLNDFLYKFECDFSTVMDNLEVQSNVQVEDGVNHVPVTNTNETVTMRVFYDSTNAVIPAASSPDIGTEVYLELEMQDNSLATGVYLSDCSVCDASDCAGTHSHIFVNSQGCQTSNAVIHNFTSVTAMLHRSDPFALFRFQQPSSNTLYFVCKIDFCYADNNGNCLNHCPGKRRKRDVSATGVASNDQPQPEDLVYAVLTFPDNYANGLRQVDANQYIRPQDVSTQWGLLAAVITLAFLLLLGMLITGIVFCKMTRNRREANGKC